MKTGPTPVLTTSSTTRLLQYVDNDWNRRRQQVRLDPSCNILAGGVGGAAGLFVGYPFDTVKVKLQTMTECRCSVTGKNALPYSGSLDCIKKILLHEGGVKGLYRGMAGPLLLSTPRFALIFQGNAIGLKLFGHNGENNTKKPTYAQIMAAGAFSQLAVVPLVVAPCERIKVLLQTQPPNIASPGQLACLKQVMSQNGFSRGLMRGTMLTYSRDIPSFTTYFLTYEFFRSLWERTGSSGGGHESTLEGVIATLVSGAAAGFLAWSVAIPFDTLKNRHQASISGSAAETFTKLVNTDGLTALWRGGVPILVRALPANAAAFLGYEAVISLLTYLKNS